MLNRRMYRIGLEALPTQKSEIENLARLLAARKYVLAVALYVEADNLDSVSTEMAAAFNWSCHARSAWFS